MDKGFVLKGYRPIAEEERRYTFAQSKAIQAHTGLVGYLRADFGNSGNEFFGSWNDGCAGLKTDAFKKEFNSVINYLRNITGILADRNNLARCCYETPMSSYGDGRNHYGFRLTTDDYAYLLRLNPNRGEYNLYCYCYQRDALDQHIEAAYEGVKFVDSQGNELFRVADGENIQIISPDGEVEVKSCRYVDEYHVEIGFDIYHLCEFAKFLEKNGKTFIPIGNEIGDVDKLITDAEVISKKAGTFDKSPKKDELEL